MFQSFLITGGCGFIGKSLINNLLEKDDNIKIIVLDNLSVGKAEDLSHLPNFNLINDTQSITSNGIYLYIGDILNKELCIKLTKNVNCIVHLAANTGVHPSVLDPRMDMENNVVGTFNMLEAARVNNVEKFIFSSSGAPAGEIEPPIHEEIAPHPVSPYGSSKLAGEGYCSSFSRTFGINTTVLRFGNVFGPGSLHKSSVVAKFINKVFDGETCEIYGDGSWEIDWELSNNSLLEYGNNTELLEFLPELSSPLN